MLWAAWIGIVLIGGADEPASPRDLVSRLVSPKSSEREEAADALRKLGDAALPALGEARESADLELRMKAAALSDALEGDRLARPTLVSLDFSDRPLPEVIEALTVQTGMNLMLEPEGDTRFRGRRVSLAGAQPVSFWAAIDLVGKAGGVGVSQILDGLDRNTGFDANRTRRRAKSGPVLLLRNDDSPDLVPHCNSGAFRLTLQSLAVDKSRTFEGDPRVTGGNTSQFVAVAQVLAEPRLTLARLGEVRVREAVDDLGQSLVPTADPRLAPVPRIQPAVHLRAGPLTIPLSYPRTPGRSIERLQGTVSAVVIGRGTESTRFTIADKLGQTLRVEGLSLIVHSLRASPDGRSWLIDLTVIEAEEPTVRMMGGRSAPASRRPIPSPAGARGQLVLCDAAGRPCGTAEVGASAIGSPPRATIQVDRAEGAGPPVEARLFATTWATVEIPFAFRNIPMP